MSLPPEIAARFDDGKADDAMRTIGEVVAALGVKAHVLRYWEQQFAMLQPLKRSGNRRLYRPEDIVLVALIDQLVNQQGYTLKGARKAIESGAEMARVSDAAAQPRTADGGADTLRQLRSIRARLERALAA